MPSSNTLNLLPKYGLGIETTYLLGLK